MSAMIPGMQNHCHYGPTEYRIVPTPLLALPPNHVLLFCLCPCGMHRTHFTIHRNVLFNQMTRNQSITQHMRTQPHIQRLAEMQLQARFRRSVNRKENNGTIEVVNEEEDGIDR